MGMTRKSYLETIRITLKLHDKLKVIVAKYIYTKLIIKYKDIIVSYIYTIKLSYRKCTNCITTL